MKLDRNHLKYWPFYCEENIWHLCQEDSFLPFERKVVFISNDIQRVAMQNQRAGSLVYWDYHVLLLFRDTGWKVADLDTLLSFPCPVEEYLSNSFVPGKSPMFRIVDADRYIQSFASDRRHMLDQDGKHLQPPPPWNEIGRPGFNLWDFVDVTNNEHGQLYDLHQMHTEFNAPRI